MSSTLAFQYYPSGSTLLGANTVSVGLVNVPSVSAQLPLGSTLQGTIVNGSAADVANVCVYLSDADGYAFPLTGTTNVSGAYSIGSVPNGTFGVLFDPTCSFTQTSPYAYQYYNNQALAEDSTPVLFSTPTTRTIDATLAAGASISGTVTVPGAVNSANVCVFFEGVSGDLIEAYAITNSNGSYQMTNLPASPYKVEFDPSCRGGQTSDFSPNWYSAAATYSSASQVSVLAGQSYPNINSTLALAVAAPSIVTASLPAGTLSTAYATTVAATGGTAPYAFFATGLPPGLSINSASGAITGTPTVAGNYTASIAVVDASTPPVVASTSLIISIAAPTPPTTTVVALPTTTMVAPHTERVCSFKTKKITVHKTEIKKGKKVTVTVHKVVRVYKRVAVKKTETIHGKKVVVITYKKVPVKVCKSVLVG